MNRCRQNESPGGSLFYFYLFIYLNDRQEKTIHTTLATTQACTGNHFMILTVSRYWDMSPIKIIDSHTPADHRSNMCICDVGVQNWLKFRCINSFRTCHFYTFPVSLLPFDLSDCLQAGIPFSKYLHSLLHWSTGSLSQMIYYEELMKYNKMS